MAEVFEPGSWVWIPHEEDMYVPAKVLAPFKAGDAGKVQTEDGEEVSLTADTSKECTAANPECLDSKIDNLINLNDLSENAILHNLRIRFKENTIYTYVSSILIAVNPFRLLPLYTPEMMDFYREGSVRGKPPHVFAVAAETYSAMVSEHKDQSIVVSGESGAGKSENTKLMLQFIADVSSRAAGGAKKSADSGGLEQQILQVRAVGTTESLRSHVAPPRRNSSCACPVFVRCVRAGESADGGLR